MLSTDREQCINTKTKPTCRSYRRKGRLINVSRVKKRKQRSAKQVVVISTVADTVVMYA